MLSLQSEEDNDNSTTLSEMSQFQGKLTVKAYWKDDVRVFEMENINYEKLAAKVNEECKQVRLQVVYI